MQGQEPVPVSWWAKSKQFIAPLFAWWPEFSKSKIGLAGLVIAITFILVALFAPVLATHAPDYRDVSIGWGNGLYWGSAWTNQGSVNITNEGEPYEDDPTDVVVEYHVRFQSGAGFIERSFGLTNPLETNPMLKFQAKAVSFEDGDEVICRISADGKTWSTAQIWENGDDDDKYRLYEIDLSTIPDWRSSNLRVGFESDMSSPDAVFYLDNVVVALSAPGQASLSPADDFEPYGKKFEPPSRTHLLGTTALAEDVWSRLAYAGRISLFIGIVASLAVVALGSTIGIFAGYFGGIIDEVLTRVADIMLVLPQLPLMIILAALMGPGMNTILFVVIVLGWTHIYRQIRALTLSVKQYSFVEAAKAVGASNIRIIIQHIMPNVAGIIIANFVLEVVLVIMLEAGLSFLGLGDPLHESWGTMLYFSQNWGAFSGGAWWWWMPPGLCIALLGMAFSFIGNTLNDRFVLRLGSRRKG